ncbi:hypothetical protein Tco_1278935 [Tanacetum coccineum]
MENPTHEPSVCKIKKFKMTKYTFEANEEYVAIKEFEHINHSETNTRSSFARWMMDASGLEEMKNEGRKRITYSVSEGTDISKITRKQSKTGNHGHENQKSTKLKPEKSSLSQNQPRKIKSAMVKAQRSVGFALNTLTQLAQAVTSKNDSLAIRVSVHSIQRLTIAPSMIGK